MDENQAKLPRHKEREFDEIFGSLEPCLKDHLISIDSILRRITSEAAIFGVSGPGLQRQLEERFWGLCREIAKGEMSCEPNQHHKKSQ